MKKICKNCLFWDNPAPSFNDESNEYYGHCTVLSDIDSALFPYDVFNDCRIKEYEIITRYSFGCNFFENKNSLN